MSKQINIPTSLDDLKDVASDSASATASVGRAIGNGLIDFNIRTIGRTVAKVAATGLKPVGKGIIAASDAIDPNHKSESDK